MRFIGRIAIVVVLLASTTISDAESPLTNKDVVKLLQVGIGDQAVIAKVRQAAAVDFQLDVDDLAALKRQGVSGAVIAVMLDRTAAGARVSVGSAAATVREPDYIGSFCFRNGATGELAPLARETGSSAIDIKAMGFGGAETYMRVAGDHSSFRLREGEPSDFVVLASSQSVDPQSIAQLVVLDVSGGERRLPVARAASMGLSGRGVLSESQIALRAVPYGRSSFLLTPVEPLAPGEYAFAGPTPGVGFSFGVDPNPGSGFSRFERTVPFKQRDVISLGISDRGMTVNSVKVIRWPEENALRKLERNAEAKGEIVIEFNQTNRAGRDYKCTYDVVLLDASDNEIGVGKRTVGIEDGEVDDTARVGISLRIADVSKAAKLRIRAVPQPDL